MSMQTSGPDAGRRVENDRPTTRQEPRQRAPELVHPAQRESKPGLASTELYVTILAIAGVLIATYVASDSLSRTDGWMYASWIAIAYIVSRGLAKLGSSNRGIERERLD